MVYLHTAAEEAAKVWELSTKDFALIAIEGINWNRDLSPWYHEKVFAGGEDFEGKADEYLHLLTNSLLPKIEEACGIVPKQRYLTGYSLGGLFAVYAMYHTSIFEGIGSISGSLWYDGFCTYVENHTIMCNPGKIYFSLGDKEAASARGSMRTVLSCTEKIAEKFRHDGIKTIFEMNPGNHFNEVPMRIWKGIRWLLQE
ncbi:MAG: alpha/beta hydrolase [Lachnospiraceae bacterium]|nr:alpha/beta hydrolase [Lachnospiraceae bacterium]